MLEYCNDITKTLTIPHDFNEKLKYTPEDTLHIAFGGDADKCIYVYNIYSVFNKKIEENE